MMLVIKLEIVIIILTEHLLCARLYMNLLSSHDNPVR